MAARVRQQPALVVEALARVRRRLAGAAVSVTVVNAAAADRLTAEHLVAPLGALLRKSLPDGRSVEQYLGPDLWWSLTAVLNSQTGPNLRNEFAHGLARPGHCTPANAGLALAFVYALAAVAGTATRAVPQPVELEPNSTPGA